MYLEIASQIFISMSVCSLSILHVIGNRIHYRSHSRFLYNHSLFYHLGALLRTNRLPTHNILLLVNKPCLVQNLTSRGNHKSLHCLLYDRSKRSEQILCVCTKQDAVLSSIKQPALCY